MHALPAGTTYGHSQTRRYSATKQVFNNGKSLKLVAEELGGTGYISLNVYDLSSGPRLFPCQMSAAKVITFVCTFTPDQPRA